MGGDNIIGDKIIGDKVIVKKPENQCLSVSKNELYSKCQVGRNFSPKKKTKG
jgi:hypothetical protein